MCIADKCPFYFQTFVLRFTLVFYWEDEYAVVSFSTLHIQCFGGDNHTSHTNCAGGVAAGDGQNKIRRRRACRHKDRPYDNSSTTYIAVAVPFPARFVSFAVVGNRPEDDRELSLSFNAVDTLAVAVDADASVDRSDHVLSGSSASSWTASVCACSSMRAAMSSALHGSSKPLHLETVNDYSGEVRQRRVGTYFCALFPRRSTL